ncbi:MAG TPA: type II/IV secretion system ATPase subunit [Thermoplasmata archaeon]|nr:type II/IV secretion system ATPase subunit [Thermoplasmata archaeon]
MVQGAAPPPIIGVPETGVESAQPATAAAAPARDPLLDKDPLFSKFAETNPHLLQYIREWVEAGNAFPKFVDRLTRENSLEEYPNLVYPVGDPVFIHINRVKEWSYVAIEPPLTEDRKAKYIAIRDEMLRIATTAEAPEAKDEFSKLIEELVRQITEAGVETRGGLFSTLRIKRIQVTEADRRVVLYHLKRDILEHGKIEPMMRDPYIEDVHCVGLKRMHIDHKLFGMLPTNMRFEDRISLDEYLRGMTERIGTPVSDARPIIDASLPGGSRLNVIYSEDVSREGSSFTIRKFSEKPMTLTQLIENRTMSPEIAAYLWMCMEQGMNVFVCGETASGKTTTLNGMVPFINHHWKVYSAEDTPEVIAPHPIWQRVVTRESGAQESRVELYDLLRAALRSRPRFIIVGEIRGREGTVAFQAMQTGHFVISTFHAPSVKQMIQRFIGDPINIPERFMDNLNVVVFQQLVYEKGRVLRRVISVDEILRYSAELGGVLTRNIFSWNPDQDTHYFGGIYNSFVLENKIAPKLKYQDKRIIYEDLKKRSAILRRMVEKNLLPYDDLNKVLAKYYDEGEKGLSEYT